MIPLERLSPHVPPPPGWTVTAAKRVDDRVNKHYWREVLITAPHPDLPPPRLAANRERRALPTSALMLALRAAIGKSVAHVEHSYHRDGVPPTLWVRVLIKAEKPSEIASEEEGVEHGCTIIPGIAKCIEAAAVQAREDARRDFATSYATRLLSAKVDVVVKEANALVRYDQRLAALDAELAAEVRAQAQKLLEGTQIDAAAERDRAEDPGVQPEALAAVRRLLVETAVKRLDDSPFYSPRGLAETDVFPPTT